MPATTPNRMYPYPIPADPTDVAGDMQRLAEAIDADLAAISPTISPRQAVRVSGTAPFVVSTQTAIANHSTALPLDVEDFNTGLDYNLDPVLDVGVPVPGVQILEPGKYLIVGTVAYPNQSGANRVEMTCELEQGFTFPIQFQTRARQSTGLVPGATDGVRTLSCAAMVAVDPSDTSRYVNVRFRSRTAAGGTDNFTVGARSLSVIRMSLTP